VTVPPRFATPALLIPAEFVGTLAIDVSDGGPPRWILVCLSQSLTPGVWQVTVENR